MVSLSLKCTRVVRIFPAIRIFIGYTVIVHVRKRIGKKEQVYFLPVTDLQKKEFFRNFAKYEKISEKAY